MIQMMINNMQNNTIIILWSASYRTLTMLSTTFVGF